MKTNQTEFKRGDAVSYKGKLYDFVKVCKTHASFGYIHDRMMNFPIPVPLNDLALHRKYI